MSGRPANEDAASSALQAHIAEALLHDLPDAVIFADTGGLIRHWNAGATRLFGFSAAEAVGQSLDLIIPERLRARHWAGFRRMIETGQSTHAPDELLSVPALTKSGGNLSIQFTIAPVFNDQKEMIGIVSLLRDFTATYAELKELRARKP